MKKSSIFSTSKAQNSEWLRLFRFLFFVFLSVTFLKAHAQCPSVIATPSSATICSGINTNIVLKSDISGAEFSWTAASTDVAGAADGKGSNINNILATMEAGTGTVVYTITPIANGCKGTPATVTIKVNPVPVAFAVPTTSTITSGTASSISLTSDVVETSFSWTVSRSGVTGAASGSGSVISQTISTVSEKGSATYRITPDFKGCGGNSINVKVVINKKT